MGEVEQSLRDGDVNVAVSPSFGGRKKRVLLVEEDPLARAFLLSKLRMEGIDVDVARTGDTRGAGGGSCKTKAKPQLALYTFAVAGKVQGRESAGREMPGNFEQSA